MATQQQVQIAAKLYECRDTARRISGASYKNFLAPTMAGIRAIANEKNLSLLEAGTELAKVCFQESDSSGAIEYRWGMTLRDWFAGKALTGLVNLAGRDVGGETALAYRYADAMIAARKP